MTFGIRIDSPSFIIELNKINPQIYIKKLEAEVEDLRKEVEELKNMIMHFPGFGDKFTVANESFNANLWEHIKN